MSTVGSFVAMSQASMGSFRRKVSSTDPVVHRRLVTDDLSDLKLHFLVSRPGNRWRTSLGSFVTLSCIEVGSFGAFSRPPSSRLPQWLRSSRFSPFSRNGQPRTTDHEQKIMPPSSIMSILHGFAFPFRNLLKTVIATIDATGKPGTSVLIDLSITIVLALA